MGEFQTVDAARNAADELRRIVKSIADWYSAHPEAAEAWNTEGICPPTPPEAQLAEQYNLVLDPEFGMDWIWGDMNVSDAVIDLGRHVFVTHPGDTWYGAYPFDRIIEKLGGRSLVDGYFDPGADHEKPQMK